jgi:prolipoprotein diacylglyceryl transferase
VAIGCRIAGLRFWSVADALAPTLLLAQAMGRIGNYFNQELFGLPTDAPWGLQIDRPNPAIPVGLPDDTLFQPTFLYEIVLNLIGFVLIMLITNQRRGGTWSRRPFWQWGKVLGLYLIWYGAVRSWLENIRIDPSQTHLGIRDNVWGAIAAIVIGVLIIAIQTRRHPGIEPSVYQPGKQWTPPDQVQSEDTYSDDDDDAEVPEKAPATSGAAAS